MFFLNKPLFAWQKKCLKLWFENNCRGIANVVTGGGKTILALGAASLLSQQKAKLKVKIIVPTTFLVSQWTNSLKEELSIPHNQIGCWYGKHKNEDNRDFMIYVVNSARYSLSRHIIADIQAGYDVLLIADECHHYTSSENSRIFEFFPIISNNNQISKFSSLGLSATPNEATPSTAALGTEFFHYSFTEAVQANILSDFSLYNIGLQLSDSERLEYDQISKSLSVSLKKLKSLCPFIRQLSGEQFFAQLCRLIEESKNSTTVDLARAVLHLSYKRRELLYLTNTRVDCACSLISQLSGHSRIIIFGERIQAAEILYRRLSTMLPNQVGRYHSEMDECLRKTTIEKYSMSQIRILVSCRALDEGLNIPQTDIGIVLSSSSTIRQRIQRIGRIIRKSDNLSNATLYYLYVLDSSEHTQLIEDMSIKLEHSIKICNLQYSNEDGTFEHKLYDQRAQKALDNARRRKYPPEIISELERNLRLGSIRSDWLLGKEACIQKLNSAKTNAERNFYIAMLSIIDIPLECEI